MRLARISALVAILFIILLGAGLFRPRRPAPIRPTETAPAPFASVGVPDRAPQPAPSEGRLAFTGQVLDGTGRPVPGAEVLLTGPRADRDLFTPGTAPAAPAPRARADADGFFVFAEFASAEAQLLARHPGHPPGWTEPFMPRPGDHRIVRLPVPVALAGRVTPPGAILSLEYRVPGHMDATQGSTAADARGDYRIDRVPSRRPFRVRVESAGYRAATFGPYEFAAGENRLDFALERGGVVAGVVRTTAGAPVEGARVSSGGQTSATDARGAFLLGGLDDRPGALFISREGHVDTSVENVPAGMIEIRLPRCAEIAGRVEGGSGLYLCYSHGNARVRTKLDAGGAFRLASLPPGRVRLDVEDAGGRRVGGAELDAPEGSRIEDLRVLLQ